MSLEKRFSVRILTFQNNSSYFTISDALVIVQESQKAEIAQRIEKLPLDIKCEFVTIPANSDSPGTADSLKLLADKVQSDALLMSCDIVTDVDLFPMLQMFRSNNASVTAMFIEDNNKITSVPGISSKFRLEKDLIAVNPSNNRLLTLSSSSDFEDTMSLTSHLLRSNHKAVFYTSMIDAHIYLVRKVSWQRVENGQSSKICIFFSHYSGSSTTSLNPTSFHPSKANFFPTSSTSKCQNQRQHPMSATLR